MTYEEQAIAEIKESLSYGCGDYIDTQSLETALSAQIPKKPINTPDNHKHFCPVCHQPIKLGKKYCGSCGQKIGYGSDTNDR